MKNILLLGSNGFIGRNLKEYFPKNCPEYTVVAPSSQELDILDETALKSYLSCNRFDVVINAAIGNPRRDSFIAHETELHQDLKMFFNLEKYCSLYGKLLYFGSGAEFDKRADICSVGEDDFQNGIPTNDYGFAKYIIGKAIERSENIYNLRIFGLFGKYEDWRTTFISGACCKALKGLPITIRQNVFFDYLYIDDFCHAIHWMIDHTPHYRTYHITSGKRVDLLTIAERIKAISNMDVPIYLCQKGLGREYTSSNRRLLREYPEMPITELDAAITDLLEYYQGIIDSIDVYSLLYQN